MLIGEGMCTCLLSSSLASFADVPSVVLLLSLLSLFLPRLLGFGALLLGGVLVLASVLELRCLGIIYLGCHLGHFSLLRKVCLRGSSY